MSLRVEITKEPGLADLLNTNEPVSDAELRPQLEAFLKSNGVAGTPIEQSLREHTSREADLTEQAFGFWQSLKRWWKGQKQEVLATEKHPVVLEAYWLTLPAVADAEATVISTQASSNETSASFTVAGIGGGPTLTLEVKKGMEFDVKDPGRAVLTTLGTFEKVQVTDADGRVIETYARLTDLEKNNLNWSWQKGSLPDSGTWGAQESAEPFNFADMNGSAIRELGIKSGTTWEIGGDLDLSQLGIKAHLGTKLTYERDVTYRYKLPGGHDYVATRYKSLPTYIWTLQT
jgi:hypothetical protein